MNIDYKISEGIYAEQEGPELYPVLNVHSIEITRNNHTNMGYVQSFFTARMTMIDRKNPDIDLISFMEQLCVSAKEITFIAKSNPYTMPLLLFRNARIREMDLLYTPDSYIEIMIELFTNNSPEIWE